MFWARRINSGYEIREGGIPDGDFISLSSDEFYALCEERAQIVGGVVVML